MGVRKYIADPTGSYIVYKPPTWKRFLSSVAGSVSLVVNGTEYRYRQGVLQANAHMPSSRLWYFKYNGLSKKPLQKHVGQRWKWFDNCFCLCFKK